MDRVTNDMTAEIIKVHIFRVCCNYELSNWSTSRLARQCGNGHSAHCDNFHNLRQTSAFTAIKLKKDAYVSNVALRPFRAELDLVTELGALSSGTLYIGG